MERTLIIGACGQLGTELTTALQKRYGCDNVIATDIRQPHAAVQQGPFETLDAQNPQDIYACIKKYDISTLYHLAALLSAKGEQNPLHTWSLNAEGTLQILEIARHTKLKRIFFPSSIAVFGPNSPKKQVPQQSYMDPTTMYGITKRAGEQLCAYYHTKYNMDVRSLRYPGLISALSPPGGGTTDYAVDMFVDCIQKGSYECYLTANTQLPMMHITDAINGTIKLMEADRKSLSVRDSYNFAALSFSPATLAAAIRAHFPDFKVHYTPDNRQQIAQTWPHSIDDSQARADWQWKHTYDLPKLVKTMISAIQKTTTLSVR